MGQKRRRSGDGQSIGGVGRGVDAHARQRIAQRSKRLPECAIEHQQCLVGLAIDLPAGRWIKEQPGAGLKACEFARMSGPGARGASGHQPAFPLKR